MSTTSPGTGGIEQVLTAADIPPDTRPVIELEPEDHHTAAKLAAKFSDSYEDGRQRSTARARDDRETLHRGLIGEVALSRRIYSAELDREASATGDAGYDLILDGDTTDLKLIAADLSHPTAPDPRLLVEAGEVDADRYVLGMYHPGDRDRLGSIELLGECRAERVLQQTPEKWPRDILNHCVPMSQLSAPPTLDSGSE